MMSRVNIKHEFLWINFQYSLIRGVYIHIFVVCLTNFVSKKEVKQNLNMLMYTAPYTITLYLPLPTRPDCDAFDP